MLCLERTPLENCVCWCKMSVQMLEPYRRSDEFDVFLVPDMWTKLQELDEGMKGQTPQSILHTMQDTYPQRHNEDPIELNTAQQIMGDHVDLRYRGHSLARHKFWSQDGNPREHGYNYYFYTGVKWSVVRAQFDWNTCPHSGPVARAYKRWCDLQGVQLANHCITTVYKDGNDSIGAHFDKPASIAPSTAEKASLITVLKLGDTARPFALHRLGEKLPFWKQYIPAGAALIMTLEANLKTMHAVPAVKTCTQMSGSMVFRTISDVRSAREVDARAANTQKNRALNAAKKRPRD